MIEIVGVREGVGQHEFRLEGAKLHHHLVNSFFGSANRVVSGIEETDLGAEDAGGLLRLRAP
jgi:hypothetical protein